MKPDIFINILKDHDFAHFMGVPCSVFTNLINYLEDCEDIKNYTASSEGEAMGLAAGFSLCGKVPVIYMQNDGYGNIINPLSSLQLLYKLPALLLISWRGEPGKKDAPQHTVMGNTILQLLDIFNIPKIILDEDLEKVKLYISEVKQHFKHNRTPFAFIIKKGYFENYEKKLSPSPINQHFRIEFIDLLSDYIDERDVLLGATGFSGRELYQSVNHNGKFYMMGSMGCLASIGMAIAEEKRDRRIFVFDGDGAILMKMGTLATVGYYKPNNLIHICFDNETYESTGGQKTTSQTVDYIKVSKACGYRSAVYIERIEEFKELLINIKEYDKPLFVQIKVKPGTVENLTRPADSPEDMKNKIMEFLK
ncbi:MAG: phosphonopyruvate decarboxylase [Spirochaetota bacterium]|nr:phosphonopyruvate decarboxylase [Spirochaetota bacterium]